MGLSPRLRGNRRYDLDNSASPRSIPAPAGEPQWTAPLPTNTGVYPRACGGTIMVSLLAGLAFGLSPRLRGNRRYDLDNSASPRSIPAPAGEPQWTAPLPTNTGVYPRACGGTIMVSLLAGLAFGLSPRLRGNQGDLAGAGPEGRSIPAPAGEPVPGRFQGSSPGVYPRACGGTSVQRQMFASVSGLSPRLRGNQPKPCPPCLEKRSIPAPAGEPSTSASARCFAEVYPRACGGTRYAHTPE